MPDREAIPPLAPPSSLPPRDRVVLTMPVVLWSIGAAAATLIMCGVLAWGSTGDEEDFRFPVLSAWLIARGGASGPWTDWTSLLGLGMPQPFVPSFAFHPLALLLRWMEPVGWVRLLMVIYTVAGTTGMWQLCGRLVMPPFARATAVVTFLLSAPTLNYAFTDLWPSTYVGWAALPWLVAMLTAVLDERTPASHVPRWAAALGLVAGVTAASAHPGHLPVYVPVVVLWVLGPWRLTRSRIAWLAVAGLIAAAIAAPVVVRLVTEAPRFTAGLSQVREPEPMPLRALITAVVHPLVEVPSMRTLFFGGAYLALAVVGCLGSARRWPGLVAGFVVSFVLLFGGPLSLPLISVRWQMRDPVTFLGILLAGLALARLVTTRAGRAVAGVAVVVQWLTLVTAGAPIITRHLAGRDAGDAAYRGAVGDTPLLRALARHMTEPGRLLYAPVLSRAVAERALARDGLGVNAPAYRGIAVVNGMFKGVSTDPVSPDAHIFYGEIASTRQSLASDAMLDVLGIRYVLAFQDEPVTAGMQRLTDVTTGRGAMLVLYENPDAWPSAFLLPASVTSFSLPRLDGCAHSRILCRDFTAIARSRIAAQTEIQTTRGGVRLVLPPGLPSLTLATSIMYRPEWTATAGDRLLSAQPVMGGLLGVPLPPDTREVTLRYAPTADHIAQGTALAGLVGGCFLLVCPIRRRETEF